MINLTHDNGIKERRGFFVYARGLNRELVDSQMVVAYDKYASGCNPYYWTTDEYYGHEFTTREDAEHQTRYAGLSWDCKRVDIETIRIAEVHFRCERQAHCISDNPFRL